jgi:hypothetical protein
MIAFLWDNVGMETMIDMVADRRSGMAEEQSNLELERPPVDGLFGSRKGSEGSRSEVDMMGVQVH